jgi:isopenicillin N synthase-like dioxygenase
VIDGVERRLIGAAHRDSGVLTLLWQPGDLQAQSPDGTWCDVPAEPGSMTVNFGDCMAFWTGGRIPATVHRVVAPPSTRFSVPFFYEPDVNTVISPIAGCSAGQVPVRYGDHVMEKIRQFRSQMVANPAPQP